MNSSLTGLSYKQYWRISLVIVSLAFFFSFSEPRVTTGQSNADEPGKAELQKLCATCHELEKAYSLKQDRAGWQRTMDKMTAFGMKSTEQEFTAVLDYLVKHYPAEAVAKVKINKATAIELESGLSLKRSQARAVIEYRDKNGPFKSIEDLKKVPGLDAARIEEKKDRLSFEE